MATFPSSTQGQGDSFESLLFGYQKVCTYTFALENSNEFMVRPHSYTFYQTTQHFSSWSHHCSFFQVCVWSSVSTLYIPSAAYSIRKGWSLIHSRDLILSFALLEFSQKRPNKPCLAGGGIRATPSKLQNKGLCVALGNSMLHSDSGLVWWPPAVNIWNPFPTWKSHPDRTAYTHNWAQWCGQRSMRIPWGLGEDWGSARLSNRKSLPELRAPAQQETSKNY